MKVLIATPLGRGGKGGIDRIMDEVRKVASTHREADLELSFGVTRGQRHIALSPFYLIGFCIRLIAARLGGVDVLHINLSSHGSTTRKLYVAALAGRLGVPYVLHLHGSRFRQYWDTLSVAKANNVRAMFDSAARVIVLGTIWKEYVRSRTGLPDERIVIVPNATPRIGRHRIRAVTDRVVILFLGRIGARKGVPELAQALVGLKDRQDWQAIIAGDGDRADFERQIASAGLQDRVQFPGWVGPDDVKRLLLNSDVLVLPSHDENLPMSVIEGMGAGMAIVTTPVGAVEDIIEDGVTGLLVPVASPDKLQAAIARLLDNNDLIGALGARALAFHEKQLDIDNYLEKLIAVWSAAKVDPLTSLPLPVHLEGAK